MQASCVPCKRGGGNRWIACLKPLAFRAAVDGIWLRVSCCCQVRRAVDWRPPASSCSFLRSQYRLALFRRFHRRNASDTSQFINQHPSGLQGMPVSPSTLSTGRRWTLKVASPAEVEVKREQPDEYAQVRKAAAAEAAAVAAAPAAPAQPWALAMWPAAVLPHHLAAGGAAAQERSSDPEELFCLSLAAHLRGLPPRDRSIAMMKMLQTLHHLEFGENIGEAALGEP
ncbi:uncharacterized protein LOC144101261 [Amblyomma americanum]